MKDFTSVVGGLFCRGVRGINKLLVVGILVSVSLQIPVYASFNDSNSSEDIVAEFEPPKPVSEREVQCLAKNIYFEARGESDLGQKAVAFVTLNRTRSSKFPDDVCAVVYQKNRGGCQFQWVCNKAHRIADSEAFDKAKHIAIRVMTMYNQLSDPSRGALYFHAKSVRAFARDTRTTALIGQHRFYR